jgi:hypothetical protein
MLIKETRLLPPTSNIPTIYAGKSKVWNLAVGYWWKNNQEYAKDRRGQYVIIAE